MVNSIVVRQKDPPAEFIEFIIYYHQLKNYIRNYSASCI